MKTSSKYTKIYYFKPRSSQSIRNSVSAHAGDLTIDSEDEQDEKSVWRCIPTMPISVYRGAKNVVTAGSQGALDLLWKAGLVDW